MQRFKNILLVYDDSPEGKAAMHRAVQLAIDNDARLKLVDVQEDIPDSESMLIPKKKPGTFQNMAIKCRVREMEKFVAPFIKNGLTTETRVLIGVPFIRIIQEVLKFEHDLVIKVARGKRRLNGMVFGTTAMRLLRKCPCPVWIMKPASHNGYQKIMAAVDPGPVNDEKNRLNHLIMELAASLAILEHCHLHVVHAWKPPGMTRFGASSGKIPRESLKRITAETLGLHRKWTHELVHVYASSVLSTRIHLLKGMPEKLIPRLAQNLDVDVIVMGTLCRTGIAGFFIGNTAEKVLQQVDCSVLTLKPEAFVTPVAL